MGSILNKLKGEDRRSIGRVKEVVDDVLANPDLFESVFNGMLSDDPVLRMRSADAVFHVSLGGYCGAGCRSIQSNLTSVGGVNAYRKSGHEKPRPEVTGKAQTYQPS